MRKTLMLPFLLLFLCFVDARADIMNLNEFMPTRLEDASPIEEKTWDAQFSTQFEEQRLRDQITNRPNVRYGMNKRLQLEALADFYSGGSERESGSVKIGGLYQLYQSDDYFPSIGIGPFFVVPTGKFAKGEDWDALLTFSSTLQGNRQVPITQLHLNLFQSYNDERGEEERASGFRYALGISHRLTSKTAVVTDILREEERKKNNVSQLLEIGFNHVLIDDVILGAGVGTALGEDAPSWSGSVGLVLQF